METRVIQLESLDSQQRIPISFGPIVEDLRSGGPAVLSTSSWSAAEFSAQAGEDITSLFRVCHAEHRPGSARGHFHVRYLFGLCIHRRKFTESGALPIGVEVTAASPVPVPPAVWLFGSGLLGLAVFSRRKPMQDFAAAV
jgi:hypothetical protein